MAQTITQRTLRDLRDDNAIGAMVGILYSAFYSVAFVWLPLCLALAQCSRP